MTQHLWYVRRNGKISGPFPVKQLRESFSLGQLDLKDEVSLDRQLWVKLRETDVLEVEHTPVREDVDADEAWRRERERPDTRGGPAGGDPRRRETDRAARNGPAGRRSGAGGP